MSLAILSVAAVLGWIAAGVQVRRVVAGAAVRSSPLLAAFSVVGIALVAVGTLLEAGSKALTLIALLPLALLVCFEGGVSWGRAHSATVSDHAVQSDRPSK